MTNFRAFSKTPCLNNNTDIYLLDLRNHGSSQHMPTMTIKDMSNDIVNFMNIHSLDTTYIMGHSLGGKVAMEFCLNNPERADGLAVVDVSPKLYTKSDTSSETYLMIKKLNEIELGDSIPDNNYKIIRDKVFEIAPNMNIGQFLLTN